MVMIPFFSPAHAQGSGPQATDFLSFLPLLAVVVFMYLFFFRAQQKKEKQHKALLEGLSRGDRVMTNSGLIGTVAKMVDDQEVLLEIAPGVQVSFVKPAISSVLGKKGLSPLGSPSPDKLSKGKLSRKTTPRRAQASSAETP